MKFEVTDLMVNMSSQEYGVQGCTAATCTCTSTGYAPDMASKTTKEAQELESLKKELRKTQTI